MHRNLLLQRLFIIKACLLCTLISYSQNNSQRTTEKLSADKAVKTFTVNESLGTASFISFNEQVLYASKETGQLLKKYFDGGNTSNEFRSVQVTELVNGLQVEKFKCYYAGIPVEHSSYMVISRNGKILSVNAEAYPFDNNFSVQPSLSKEQALLKAFDFVKANKYAWDALEEDMAKFADNPAARERLEKLRQEYFPEGELVIAKDVYGDGSAKLAWKFDIYAVEPLGRYNIYIDAATGKLLLRDMLIKHIDQPVTDTVKKFISPFLPSPIRYSQQSPDRITASEVGIAHTRYAGIRNIYTTRISVPLLGMPDPNNPSVQLSYSGVDPRTPILLPEQVFILKDDTRGNGIETYDMNGVGGAPVSLPALHSLSLAFVDRNVLAGSENVWRNETAGGTNEDHMRGATNDGSIGADEAANDDYALDAHWGAGMVYDYWKNVHGRFSFDNRNSAIKSYVHYGPAYDNAFWNGSVMTYGDGSGTTALGFKPLTSLDVCGHEIGHGICSYTADLVYESESGAMNEALSDIWAASIERYVVLNVDPSLASVYKPFSIGEQISVDANDPLRRMDNPKAQSNPDTYGGQYWENPVCTPTLANDECGVHTNSGVLNKWYYLIVAGSGAGSGPDASYAVPGADDGLADNGALYNTVPYSVTGIGFNKAQTITYLMELSLTPNATYAQARAAAINAARILYGECSQEEIAVTNAFFAVGVGPVYSSCGLPVISASSSATDVRETAGGTACDRYNEYNVNVNLTAPQGSATTVNFSIGATSLSVDEYSLLSNSVTYNPGETGQRTVKLRIYDDAMVEADEMIEVNVSCASPALNQTFTFTVRNDDLDPIIGGVQTLLSENFESIPVGPYTTPASSSTWGSIDKITPSPVQWSVRTDGAVPGPISYTTKRAIIEMPLLTGEALYDQLNEANSILRTPLINATGLNSIRVQFTYEAGGEPACDPACDYGRLMYSYDGTNFAAFNDAGPLFLSLTDASFDFTLPPSFNGKQFYLGIQWYNDANGGTSGSVTLDNFLVTARGRSIESQLADAVSEKINAEVNKPSYFYSVRDGELMARLSNGTSHNYSCMTATIEKSGSNAFELYVNGTDHHRVGDKVVRMIPFTNNASGNYTVTLYFTEAEILAIEAYTSFTRNQFYIYKTEAASYASASAANTTRVAATYTAIPGIGGSFTASFTTGFSAFAVGAAVSIALPVNCIDFKVSKMGNAAHLQWKVTDETNNAGFEIERSMDGINFNSIGFVPADPINAGAYSFDDNNIAGYNNIYYRLRQKDIGGNYKYICTVLRFSSNTKGFDISNVYPNPGHDEAYINIVSDRSVKLNIEYINTSGVVVNRQVEQVQNGSSRIQLKIHAIAAGVYFIRFRDENGMLLGSQRYIKQ